MVIKSALAGLLVFILLMIINPQGGLLADEKAPHNDTFKCALALGWAEWRPYHYSIGGQDPVGWQIDLIKKIAKGAGCQLTYVNTENFTKTINSIKNGQIDVAMDMTVTEQRKEFALFSESYRKEIAVLYSTPQTLADCKEKPLAELVKEGFRLGLLSGIIYGNLIENLQSTPGLNSRLVFKKDFNTLYQMVIDKKLDGLIDDPVVVTYRLTEKRQVDLLKSCQSLVSMTDVSLMFSKKTVPESVISRINQSIAEIKKTKAYKNKWIW